MRYKKPSFLQGGAKGLLSSTSLTSLNTLRSRFQTAAPKRFPVLQSFVALVIIFQLLWLYRTFSVSETPQKDSLWSADEEVEEEEEEVRAGDKYDEVEEGVFVRKGKSRPRVASKEKVITMRDFKDEVMEDHLFRQNILMGDKEGFTSRLKEKRNQVSQLQGLAQLRAQAYNEGQRGGKAQKSGQELYQEALDKRRKPWKDLLKKKNAGKVLEDVKKAEKARQAQQKWEKLLAMDDKGKTEQEREELQLLQEAEGRQAAGTKDAEAEKPVSIEDKWKAMIEMEDKSAKKAKSGSVVKAESKLRSQVEDSLEDAVGSDVNSSSDTDSIDDEAHESVTQEEDSSDVVSAEEDQNTQTAI